MTSKAADKKKETAFFEVDYEKNCSPLYKAIENAIVQDDEDYTEITKFLETGKWSDGGTKGASADVQAKTWVTRFKTDTKMKRSVEWSQLPLHLAIVGRAPSNVIGALVKLYPQALRCTDDQQMLPLHLSLRHDADDEVVAFLLMQFSEAVNAKGKNGRTAIDCALRARSKLRGIILETFVEKTKARLLSAHKKEKDELSANYNAASQQLTEFRKESEQNKHVQGVSSRVQAKYEALNAENSKLQSEHAALRLAKDLMEEELSAKLHNQDKSLSGQLEMHEKAFTKMKEKLTCEMMTERAILQKRVDFLMAEKVAAQEAAAKIKAEAEELRKTIDELHKKVEVSKDYKELKTEVAALQKDFLTKEKYQAKQNISSIKDELKSTLESTMKENITQELKDLQKAVKQLEQFEKGAKTAVEVEGLRSQVEKLSTELRASTEASAHKVEIAQLKKDLDSLRSVVDVSDAMAKSSPELLESMTVSELDQLKQELQTLDAAARTKFILDKATTDIKELDSLYGRIYPKSDGNIKKELQVAKEALDGMQKYVTEDSTHDHLVPLAKDIDSMKEHLVTKEVAVELKLEAYELEKSVTKTMESSSGKQKKELAGIQAELSVMTNKIDNSKELEELSTLKAQLPELSAKARDVDVAVKIVHELGSLTKTCGSEVASLPKKTKHAIAKMILALQDANLEETHRQKLQATFDDDIKKTSSLAESEIIGIKEKLGTLDVSKPSNNKWAWNDILNEVNVLKMEVKKKADSVDGLLTTIEETIVLIEEEEREAAEAKAVAGAEAKAKLASLLPVLPKGSPGKKPKLAKFFKRFSRYSSEKADKCMDGVACGAVEDTCESIGAPDEIVEVPTMVPPSLSQEDFDQQEEQEGGGDNDSASGVTMPPAVEKIRTEENEAKTPVSNEMEMTLSLHQTMSMKDPDAEIPGSPKVIANGEVSFLPKSMRKVKSMDPSSMPSFKAAFAAPSEFTRSLTRLITGDQPKELEPVVETTTSPAEASIPL